MSRLGLVNFDWIIDRAFDSLGKRWEDRSLGGRLERCSLEALDRLTLQL